MLQTSEIMHGRYKAYIYILHLYGVCIYTRTHRNIHGVCVYIWYIYTKKQLS